MIEEDLVTYLKTVPGVTALVGDRIEPLVVSQGSDLPVLTYQVIDTPREASHSGPSGLAHPRIQLNCFGITYTQARNLAREVRFALDGFKGTMSGRNVFKISAEDELDDYDPVLDRWRRILDVIVWHREEVA